MGAWDVISCPLGSKMLPSHGHPGTRHTEITVEKGWGKRVRKRWDKNNQELHQKTASPHQA